MKFKKIALQWWQVLKDNDIIVSIDGNKVKSIMEVSKFIMMSTDEFINFTVNRYDQDLNF